MKWWSLIPNTNCLFAIDSESIVNKTEVKFTNNPLKGFKQSNGESKVKIKPTGGFQLTNFVKAEGTELLTYRSLAISNTNLIFDTHIYLPEEFTLILKCRIYNNSVFLSSNGSYRVLQYYTTEKNVWKVSDGLYVSGADYTDAEAMRSYSTIQTVILKGSISQKNVELITDYGTFSIPSNSVAYTTGALNTARVMNSVGNGTSTTNRLDSDVIAYGLFDKIFTPEEISLTLNSIDEQFLLNKISDVYFAFNKELSDKYTNELHYNPKDSIKLLEAKQDTSPTELYMKFSQTTLTDNLIVSRLYKNMKTITDVILEEGQPIVAKLFLYERGTGTLIKTTTSDIKGQFYFYNLSKDYEYRVTSNDPKYQFRTITKTYEEFQR